MVMKSFIKGAVLVLALLLCYGYPMSFRAAAPGQGKESKQEWPSVSPAQLASAKTIFAAKCARCHGVEGNGKTVIGEMVGATDFTNEKWWKEEATAERLTNSITDGKNEMPAFGKKLSKQEILSLIAYLRRFDKSFRTTSDKR